MPYPLPSRKLALQVGGWTAAALFFFSQSATRSLIERNPALWWGTLAHYLIGVYVVALLAPVILWPSRRLPIERAVWLRRTALHLILSIIFSFLILALAAANDSLTSSLQGSPHAFWDTYRSMLVWNFHAGITLYWLLVGGDHALRYYRKYRDGEKERLRLALRASELQKQLTGAELQALKAQLHPHFLFNTLNAVMVLVRRGRAEEAETTLGHLSALLRCVLEDVESQEVPLRRELEFLRLYLAIEQVRFGDRLHIETLIEPETLNAAVPHLCLQPLVENAIRHGIGQSSSAGRVSIRTQRKDDRLEIFIDDDGPGMRVTPGKGLGLANVRDRLAHLYGASGLLQVANSVGRGVQAALSIPYRDADSCQPGPEAVHVTESIAG